MTKHFDLVELFSAIFSQKFQFSSSQNGTLANKKVGIIIFGTICGYGARIFMLFDDIWRSNHDNTRFHYMVFTDDTSISIVSLWAVVF